MAGMIETGKEMECALCGNEMKLAKIETGTWAGGEYDEEIWICNKCGRTVKISPFGDTVMREGGAVEGNEKWTEKQLWELIEKNRLQTVVELLIRMMKEKQWTIYILDNEGEPGQNFNGGSYDEWRGYQWNGKGFVQEYGSSADFRRCPGCGNYSDCECELAILNEKEMKEMLKKTIEKIIDIKVDSQWREITIIPEWAKL